MPVNTNSPITPSAESVKVPTVNVQASKLTPQQLIEQMKNEGVSASSQIGGAIAGLYNGVASLASKASGIVAEGVAIVGGPLVYAIDALLKGLDGLMAFDPERYIQAQIGMLTANASMRDKLKDMAEKAKTEYKAK